MAAFWYRRFVAILVCRRPPQWLAVVPILAIAATTIVSSEALAERDRGTWASSRHIWDVMTGQAER